MITRLSSWIGNLIMNYLKANENPTTQMDAQDIVAADDLKMKIASIIPIRTLRERHRTRIAQHILELGDRDRYLRFGFIASDEQIKTYVQNIDFERDEVFGVFNRKLELVAVAHLAIINSLQHGVEAEFGVSVCSQMRGYGLGSKLFTRAVMHARNAGAQTMFIHALTENVAMLKIARNAGATVERTGSEAQAVLRLPQPTFDSHMAELIHTQFGEWDYGLKAQSKQFREFLQRLQPSSGS